MDKLRTYGTELDLEELIDGLDVEAKVKMGITEGIPDWIYLVG